MISRKTKILTTDYFPKKFHNGDAKGLCSPNTVYYRSQEGGKQTGTCPWHTVLFWHPYEITSCDKTVV